MQYNIVDEGLEAAYNAHEVGWVVHHTGCNFGMICINHCIRKYNVMECHIGCTLTCAMLGVLVKGVVVSRHTKCGVHSST